MWNLIRRKPEHPTEDNKREKFRKLMDFAELVLQKTPPNTSPHPILDVIRMYGRQAQADYLMNPFTEHPDELDSFHALFKSSRKYDIFSKLTETQWEGEIDLSKDVVLPWPWHTTRLLDAVINIGSTRKWGTWKQDPINHQILLLLPIGVSFVEGGNHSLAAGIIQGQGMLTPVETVYAYDMTQLYAEVETDGAYYFRKADHSIISEVKWISFAAIFEIGRKMIAHHITY